MTDNTSLATIKAVKAEIDDAIVALKSMPTVGTVHHDRPLELDDPGTQDVNPPETIPADVDAGIQDPFDTRNADDDKLPRRKRKGNKKDDDPGTQDVNPPNQASVSTAPLDVIVPQTVMKRISGSSPIGLNELGKSLAKKMAARIAAKGCLDVIYSSTLPRGVETVMPVLEACPHCEYAGAFADLEPWHLGAYEGKEPKDVKGQIVYFIEHPDELPPGKGMDGEPAETFDHAKIRQLSFFAKVYADYEADPTLKIGIQTHSRGQELLLAWLDADRPEDFDIRDKDVIHPDEQPHASIMRWHKVDECKEVDLDSDLPLKPGVYLILHSLTDDDTDGGNPELEKSEANKSNPDQPRDDRDRFGAGGSVPSDTNKGDPGSSRKPEARTLWHGTSAGHFDEFDDRPTYLTDDAVHSLMFASDPIMGGGNGEGEPRLLEVLCAPGSSKDITVYTQPEFDKGVDGDVDAVVTRMGADALAAGHAYVEFDHPSSHHDATDTFRSVVSLAPRRDLKIVGVAKCAVDKFDADQPRDANGRFGSADIKLGTAQTLHDRLKDHAGRAPSPSHAAQEDFQGRVTVLGDKVRELAAHPAFNVKINRSGDKARAVILNHVKQGDAMRRSAVSADKGWHNDLALSHYHDALLTMSRVLGSKWVGKSADHLGKVLPKGFVGTRLLYHGTSAPPFAFFSKGSLVYLAEDPKETHVFAENSIAGGGRSIGEPRVMTVLAKGGTYKDISRAVDDGFMNDEDVDEVIGREADKAREEGHSYVTFNHPSGVEGRDEFRAIVSVSPDRDLKITDSRNLDPSVPPIANWVMINGRHVLLKSGRVEKLVYMPPLEVHRAAISAIEKGASVIDITYPLAESQGLTLDKVREVAKFFASSESASVSDTARDAWGGTLAAKWSLRVLAKVRDKWKKWVAVDLDGTLAKKLPKHDGTKIGPPNMKMIARVKDALDRGVDVRIFTARVADDPDGVQERAVKLYCRLHIGKELPVTNEKDPGMCELWDDLAVDPAEIDKSAHSGVMIALMLDAATANRLSDDIGNAGEDPKDMHVTLVYLGKGLDQAQLTAIERAVRVYASEHAPLDGDIGGPVRFAACPATDGKDVCVASFENLGIQEFRAGLVNAIKAAGVAVNRSFSYMPHVTLKYIGHDDDMPVQRIGPLPVTFNKLTMCVGDKRVDFPLSGRIVKAYNPDQPRDERGRFGSGGDPVGSIVGRRLDRSDRVERARKSCVLIRTKEQAIADRTEQRLSDALGIPRTKNNSAFDLRNDDVGIEVKTLLVGTHEKITMSKSALARKVAEQHDDDLRGYTIVADMRGGRERAAYYYKEGFGSFRLGSMTKVTLPELKGIIR